MFKQDIEFHPIEDEDSKQGYLERQASHHASRRQLHHNDDDSPSDSYGDDSTSASNNVDLEQTKEEEFRNRLKKQEKKAKKLRKSEKEQRKQLMSELYANPGIAERTVHGLMIDAGSTGSRMHVYEWEPRVLYTAADVEATVAGNKLSYPGTDSRWTDRLQPGLSEFASIADHDELKEAIANYLEPLLSFAKTILHSKQSKLAEYPIFLRATAGMRTLDPEDRARVMGVVRDLFSNKTYCPFAFVDEQARILSGEEEAIFDWTGVNFLLGDLIDESQGAGTVVQPKLTHGALDLGGASTQIGFYEPGEDIMSNLFKLQIGQAKHWNLYAHSFLMFGLNQAMDRFNARLAAGKSTQERLVDGIYDPCLSGGVSVQIRTNTQLDSAGNEMRASKEDSNQFYHAIFKNDNERGDADLCLEQVKGLLHLEKNEWCDFAHQGDCSFNGIYQPALPQQDTDNFGEFVAFSNYYHIWKFLQLPERATIAQLENATRYVCSMTKDELIDFNSNGKVSDDELDSYCFRSAYAFQLLHSGYGFKMTDTIRVTNVIHGQKVGWALGAMLYEINAMPWKYVQEEVTIAGYGPAQMAPYAFLVVILGVIASVLLVVVRHSRRVATQDSFEGDDEFTPLKTTYDTMTPTTVGTPASSP